MAVPQGLTIDQLRELLNVESHLFLPIDSPNETFKVTIQTLVSYMRETMNITPTGSAIMWLGDVIPKGYIELAGQSFNVGILPKLGTLFPGGVLPDTRGMVLKHVKDGRVVLSLEDDAVKSHDHTASFIGNPMDPHTHTSNAVVGPLQLGGPYLGSGIFSWTTATINPVSAGVPTGSVTVNPSGSPENLVKNIGVKFIVKQE